MLTLRKLAALAVSVLLAAQNAMADETVDVRARLEALQQQIQVLSAELHAVQEKLANTKEEKTAEKIQSKGEPVYASFKDGLVFGDGSENWSMQINGRVQADYRNIAPTEWKNDTFSIRRARLGGTFTTLKDFAVRVEGEYASSNDGAKGTTALTYGYLDYNHFPGARLRVGQFKPIFGLERGESTNFTDFMELSLATATGHVFNSTYDRGLMLFGAPLKGAYYNLSYVNGSGQNNDSPKDSKDIVGRFAANIADWAEWKNSVVHLGVSTSKNQVELSSAPTTIPSTTAFSAYTESNGITSNTAAYTGTTATKFFSVNAFTGNVDKKRVGLETALAYGPVKFQGEYITTDFDQISATRKSIDASYASVTWLVTGENYADSYKNGMFNRIYPKQNFSWGNSGLGGIELGLRYSRFDASDFVTVANGCVAGTGCLIAPTVAGGVTTAAYTNKANAWTAGAKWMLTSYARLMLNYVDTRFDTPVTINSKPSNDEKALTMRAQYDF